MTEKQDKQILKKIIALKKKIETIQKQKNKQADKIWDEIESLRKKRNYFKVGSRVLIHKMMLHDNDPQWVKDLLGAVGHITKFALYNDEGLFTPEDKRKRKQQIWLELGSFLPVAPAPRYRLKKTK